TGRRTRRTARSTRRRCRTSSSLRDTDTRLCLSSQTGHPSGVPRLVFPGVTAGFILAVFASCSDDPPPPPVPTTPCKPPERAAAPISLAPAFGDVKFTQPVELVFGPNQRLYVVEQAGKVKVLPVGGGDPTIAFDFGTRLSANNTGEAGLLGI